MHAGTFNSMKCKDPSNQTPNHFQTPIFFANEDNGCAHLVSVDFF